MKKSSILKICGFLGIISCVIVIASNVVGMVVNEKHNPISDTISMLAIGKYGWIQDWGLDALALGYLALAIGLFIWKPKGTKWIASLIILVLISFDLILIAEHNQYAERPSHTGYVIHLKLVYLLTGLFLILTILISFDLKLLETYLKRFSLWIAGCWLILAPLMMLIPDAYVGAYERFVCAMLVIWPTLVSYQLIKVSSSKSQVYSKENIIL